MRSTTLLPLVLCAALAASCASINGPRGGRIFLPAANKSAGEQFERIKSLEGAWQWAPELAPELTGLVVTYRLTGNGSAMIETLFPGDAFEMTTIYHLDGKQLILTHYCSTGNQPTMRAQPGEPDGAIRFEYMGATNLDSVNDGHMHSMSFFEIEPDHLLTSWTFYADQKPAGDKVFKLVRFDPTDTDSVEPDWKREELESADALPEAL